MSSKVLKSDPNHFLLCSFRKSKIQSFSHQSQVDGGSDEASRHLFAQRNMSSQYCSHL